MMNDLEQERNKELIKERETYEKNFEEDLIKQFEEFENSFLDNIIENMVESDEFNMLMADRLEYINDNFDFQPSPAYEELEQLLYQEMEALFEDENKIENYEFPIAEDGSDIEGYDYPEGYNDIPFDYGNAETFLDDDFEGHSYDLGELYDLHEISEKDYQEYLIDSLIDDSEDKYMEKLIEEHLEDEKNYLDSIVKDAIQEGYYFTKAIDKTIFDHINLDYENQSIDYEESPQYWFKKPLESSSNKEDNENDEQKVQSMLKNHFTKDETLDNIIEEKIKDKKLN